MNKVSLIPAGKHRNIVENLFNYYVYDLAETGKRPCGDDGRYSYSPSLLDPHWLRDDHWPWLIYYCGELAGFCLLRRYPLNLARYDTDQFFVLKKFKGQGVGKAAFHEAVTRMPGLWQTRVLLENKPAQQFWRSAIGSLTKGNYQEAILPDGDLAMLFFHYQTPAA